MEKDDRRINAKSLLGVLSLGITKGSKINLIADGVDEEEAVYALIELCQSNFPKRNQTNHTENMQSRPQKDGIL